ncbi:MAG: OmpA family protein, partial [Candidatus Tectomicrobia bacterium]|nr:OmpA family protein [Candidatus Tectomicrobia bacterium]
MKKVVFLMAVIFLAGCTNNLIRVGQAEQLLIPSQATMGREFRSEKIYRILEEKGAYYVVKLKAPGAPMSESEPLTPEPPKTTDPFPVGKEVAKTQSRITGLWQKPGLKMEMPKGPIPGGTSNNQPGAITDLKADSHSIHMADIKVFPKEVKSTVQKIKKEPHMSGEKPKKETPATLKSELARVESRLKLFENISSHEGRKELTIFFPQDKAFLLKGTKEHNRLKAFADSITKEAAGQKVFLTLIGVASAKGNNDYNLRLSQQRAEYVKKVLAGLLANVPHEFYRVQG